MSATTTHPDAPAVGTRFMMVMPDTGEVLEGQVVGHGGPIERHAGMVVVQFDDIDYPTVEPIDALWTDVDGEVVP
jgi:hypothetical protein